MITIIGPTDHSAAISTTEAATKCEEAFNEMAESGQKLSLGRNPKAITIYPYYLASRYISGPVMVFIGSIEEIDDLAKRIEGLLAAERYLGIFDTE